MTQSRVGGEAAADQVGLFLAGEDSDRVAGRGLNAVAKFGAVGGVAHGTGGDERNSGGVEGGGVGEQGADRVESACHAVFTQPRRLRADAGADAGVERADLEWR